MSVLQRVSWSLVSVLALLLAFALWATDGVTLKGDRTIYTAECDGDWQGDTCLGILVPSERYRFVARRKSGEVLVWTAGSPRPSNKYTRCDIVSGRNWQCEDNGTLATTIAREMRHGKPVKDESGRAIIFHQVSKLRWHLLLYGIPTGNVVSED